MLTRFASKLMFDKECNPGHKWGNSQKPQRGWCNTLLSIYQWSEAGTESEMSLKWKCFTPQHGRSLHPLATTDRPMCQQTGFYLLLRDLEIKKNINKLKTCKYTNMWKSERKYEMTKGACAVLSSSPRSQMVYTIRSVSALVPAQWPQETVTLHATYPGSRGHFSKYLIRVKYPVRKTQYPNTNSPDWSTYISLKNWLREFVCTSKLFTSADHFINSYQIFSKLCTDNVKRKLTLVSQSWDLKG